MNRFDDILQYFDGWMREVLIALSADKRRRISEIRLREGLPLTVTVGALSFVPDSRNIVTADELQRLIFKLCERSVYTHSHEMAAGYIALAGGHRAGVSGRMGAAGMSRVTSVNLRVAHQIIGAADMLMTSLGGVMTNVIIAGSPCSGKTTVLRDACRQLSLAGYAVGIVDERGEISADGAFDLGRGCDVMTGCSKADGITMLMRSMSPQVIAFDEIGTPEDGAAVNRCLQCGAAILTTIHADGCAAARARLQKLGLNEALYENIFVLDRQRPGTIIESSRVCRGAV